MHTTLRTLVAALTLAVSTPLAAQTPAPPPPLVKSELLRQISPHVHIIPDESVPLVPNVGYVVGSTGILVIDTGLGPRNGAAVAAVAQRLGAGKRLYLVTTHFHPEHDLGAQAFPADTTVIRSLEQQQDIQEFGLALAKIFSERSQINAELLRDAQFRKADITFDREYDLDLGGVRASIMAMGPNHTRGDTATWVEADRVLFSGDVAMRHQPAFASPMSRIGHWLSSLDRLEALKPAIVVPAHGPTGDVAFIQGYRRYLTEVRDRAAAARRSGQSVDSAVDSVSHVLGERYPDRGRLSGAIRQGYNEAQ